MAIYSHRLAAGAFGNPTNVYTCPAAITTVLRDLELFLQSGASEPATLLSIGVSGSSLYFFNTGPWSNNATRQWTGRLILLPGDELTIWPGSAAAVVLHAMGYQLTQP